MVKITSDSTCDLGAEVEKRHIGVMPLKVILDTDSYLDGVDISPEDIFSFVARTKILPKTSAPSIEDYKVFFAAQTKNGDEVVHFNISSKASASHSCALAAAKEFDGKVRVVDSLALSSGQGASRHEGGGSPRRGPERGGDRASGKRTPSESQYVFRARSSGLSL